MLIPTLVIIAAFYSFGRVSAVAHGPIHPQRPHRHHRETVVAQGLVDRRRGHRAGGRSGLPGRHPPRGIHIGLWRWQVQDSQVPLGHDQQGKIGYVFSRGGDQLMPSQTLARVIECNNFQGRTEVPASNGQKGRQRGILREGVYAINIALFNVITEDRVFTLEWAKSLEEWQQATQGPARIQSVDH